MPAGPRDPVAAIGWGCLPAGKSELSPLLRPRTRTTYSRAYGRQTRCTRQSCLRTSWVGLAAALGKTLRVSSFFRRHLVHIYQDVFAFHLDPKHSLGNLRRGSDNGAGPNVEL